MKPEEIEATSFEIIEKEAGAHGFAPDQWQVVRRMIHTSADFEYLRCVRFHPQAIAAGVRAIQAGNTIITDTQMLKAGIRRPELDRFNVSLKCFIRDSRVVETAARNGITRAQTAVDAAVAQMPDGIYVIGNAPTALLRLTELVQQKKARPALIVGLPVGFVAAAESKAVLRTIDHPYITNTGRKGGSTVAASVINALLKMAVSNG